MLTLVWSPVCFWSASVLAALIFKHWLYDLPRARRHSRALGLQTLLLLPVNYHWAVFLIRLSGAKLQKQSYRAYEVHLPEQDQPWCEVRRQVEADLLHIRDRIPGLFLWETSAPIPERIRREIRQAVVEGLGFWKRGGYKIPRFPGTQLELGKKRHHGAVFHYAKEEVRI